ncbi:hypothetical protein C8F04DRAFT_1288385 [Mycena alexandri]|uniref:CCHC-type domain-containing protein n=1 Tax=Mycena alexandri TaxID=1745969 RepID=A0AAD6WY17_9AGAR|nr:hypothetical protein C8F04DRAFT_1288385 [Mycena alexandri]
MSNVWYTRPEYIIWVPHTQWAMVRTLIARQQRAFEGGQGPLTWEISLWNVENRHQTLRWPGSQRDIVVATATPTATVVLVVCSNCGRRGHEFADCFQRGGAKEGQIPDWYNKRHGDLPVAPVANFAGVMAL